MLAAAAVLPSCGGSSPQTGIVAEITSNLSVPGELDDVLVRVTSGTGATLYEQSFPLTAQQHVLPLRVGVQPSGGGTAPIRIQAIGRLGPDAVVMRSATLPFVSGRVVLLPLPLLAACLRVTCSQTAETCLENGSCVPDTVDSDQLPPDHPGGAGGAGGRGGTSGGAGTSGSGGTSGGGGSAGLAGAGGTGGSGRHRWHRWHRRRCAAPVAPAAVAAPVAPAALAVRAAPVAAAAVAAPVAAAALPVPAAPAAVAAPVAAAALPVMAAPAAAWSRRSTTGWSATGRSTRRARRFPITPATRTRCPPRWDCGPHPARSAARST